MNYYVDYFDFYLGGRANRIIIKNRILRLKYDILCINPQKDILIFTLTETLLEDSYRVLVKYDDFWENGIFKIALDKKYKNVKVYIKKRINLLNNEKGRNFELDIFNTKISHKFFDEYLEDKLQLKNNKSYIIYRTSDADKNNRELLRKRIEDTGQIYFGLKDIKNISVLDNITKDLFDRCNDKKQIFQRGYIIRDIFQKYPYLQTSKTFLYNLFDQNYNDAMALSVDAIRLSTMKNRINGSLLANFILCMDPILYKKINLLSSNQLYLLASNKSWQVFVQNINELYVYLWEINKIPHDHNIYKYYKKRVDFITCTYKCIIEIMDRVIGLISIPEPFWRIYYEQTKYDIEILSEHYFRRTYYILWLASEIFEKKKFINMIIDDIIGGN